MDSIEFAKGIPPETLAKIFKDWFEYHMAAYYISKGMPCGTIHNVDVSETNIIYNIHILNEEDKEEIERMLQEANTTVSYYGIDIKPNVFINGDLLCISIKKE